MPGTTTSQNFALAIDIGGTKVDIAFVDQQGNLISRVGKFAVPFDNLHRAIPEELLRIFEPYIKKSQDLPGKFCGIGLSLCGNVNITTGEAVLVPNLQWRYVPFSQMILERFTTPVYAATDVRMAALAELLWGAAQGYRNFAWCTIGTGFGAYLYLDGKFFDGTHGFAGNIGHITLDEINGYPCGCGRRGCFETFTAGPAIARAGFKAAEQGKSEVLKSIVAERDITARDVFTAGAEGDVEAMSILDEVVRLISINLGGLVNTLDLDIIVLGGGVVNGSSDFVPRISQKIREYLMTEEAIRDLKVVKETFENSALIGAAADVFLREKILSLVSDRKPHEQ